MSPDRFFSFVVPVNSESVYQNNFLSSPLFQYTKEYEIVPLYNAPSAAIGYNSVFSKVHNEIVIFCHQDMFFPSDWLKKLNISLDFLEKEDPSWGVLGCYGMTEMGVKTGYIFCNVNKSLGHEFTQPRQVQTLDEIVLIIRADTILRFDPHLPGFHFYGSDICLAARKENRNSYAISAFCFHNSNQLIIFPKEFISGYKYVRKRWERYLPVFATCITIEKSPIPFYFSHYKSIIRCYLQNGWKRKIERVSNPRKYFEQIHNELRFSKSN